MQSQKNNLVPVPIQSDSAIIVPGIQRVAEFFQFAQWLATPGQFRQPKTQKEFAAIIGVSQDTLTDWKRNPKFWPLVSASLSEWIKEKIPDAVGGLYIKARDEGSAREVELFLRLANASENKPKTKRSKN